MLHPSERDLSEPFDYVAGLWTETQPALGTGTIEAGDHGIRLLPNAPVLLPWIQTQFIPGFNPHTGRMILIAARILIEDLDGCDFWFGSWVTAADVFTSPPEKGILFRRDSSNPPRFYGQTRDQPPPSSVTSIDFDSDPPEGSFFDLAIVIRRIGPGDSRVAEFLRARPDGTWESKIVTTNIPVFNDYDFLLRPSFVYRRPASSGAGAYVRSLRLEEIHLRE